MFSVVYTLVNMVCVPKIIIRGFINLKWCFPVHFSVNSSFRCLLRLSCKNGSGFKSASGRSKKNNVGSNKVQLALELNVPEWVEAAVMSQLWA